MLDCRHCSCVVFHVGFSTLRGVMVPKMLFNTACKAQWLTKRATVVRRRLSDVRVNTQICHRSWITCRGAKTTNRTKATCAQQKTASAAVFGQGCLSLFFFFPLGCLKTNINVMCDAAYFIHKHSDLFRDGGSALTDAAKMAAK